MKHDLNWLTARPIAHRGLHNGVDILENSISAARAAVDYNCNIEMDMQPVRHSDTETTPVIFHDFVLDRLTGENGNVRDLNDNQLRKFRLGKSNDTIPTFEEMLSMVAGRTGILLELKGHKDDDQGFAKSVADCLKSYTGPVALMSFSHWLIRDLKAFAPDLPIGLTAMGDDSDYDTHKHIADECAIDFVSYNFEQLPCRFATEFQQSGKPLISWTIKTRQQAREAMKHCDQITFEGFDPKAI